MKQDPRPTIHMEKLLLIAVKLGGMEPQVISRARQTVLAKLMESQMWYPSCQCCGFMWGKAQKRDKVCDCLSVREKDVPSSCLDARHFSFSLYATGTFHTATLVLELRESESE